MCTNVEDDSNKNKKTVVRISSRKDNVSFYENHLQKLISTDDGSEISKKMIAECKNDIAKAKKDLLTNDVKNNTYKNNELPRQCPISFHSQNNSAANQKHNDQERITYMRIPDENGNMVSLTAPKSDNTNNTDMPQVTPIQNQSSNNPSQIFNYNHFQRISTLLRTSKDPRINIENVENFILQKAAFINIDCLRIYDPDNGYYKKLSKNDTLVQINKLMPENIHSFRIPSDTTAIRNALETDPNIQLNPEQIQSNGYLINCINGVLCFNNVPPIQKPSIVMHNRSFLFLNCVQANYYPEYSIKNSYFEMFIMTITNGNYELLNLIQEVMGYAFSNFNNAKKAFLLYGESNSGKSVLLNIISHICGEENISNVPLQNLSNEIYVAKLFGKLINICSELPDRQINDTGTFKSLVSETDKVNARELYNDPFSFYNKCKLFFATNNLPEIQSSSYKDSVAFFNRLMIIPFKNSIPENRQDKDLIYKLLKEKDIIFSWSIDGLIRYINNGYKFSKCYESDLILSYYMQNGNPILLFIQEKCKLDVNGYVHLDRLFDSFTMYCKDNFLDPPTLKDKRKLKCILKEKYGLSYRKLNRKDGNKYGFEGLTLLD